MKISELVALITALFIQELYQEDVAEAERVKAAGCPHCGGVLHCGNYQRKPRGIVGEALRLLGLDWRISFCCSNEECRKRSTPKSVRFLGRKVYLGVCPFNPSSILPSILLSHTARSNSLVSFVNFRAVTELNTKGHKGL